MAAYKPWLKTDDRCTPSTASFVMAFMVNTHRNLLAWREAMVLVETVYHDTAQFPSEETFGLKSQIRRAAISIPANIAEGAARNSPRELVQFLSITCGSVAELETHLELAVRLGYLKPDVPSVALAGRVGMLVRTLRKSRKAALESNH